MQTSVLTNSYYPRDSRPFLLNTMINSVAKIVKRTEVTNKFSFFANFSLFVSLCLSFRLFFHSFC